MDILIKNNIIKSTKVIVDVGHKYIKLIGVKFENKHAVIFCSDKIDSGNVFLDDEINAHELTKLTAGFIRQNRIRNCEVSLSLPSDMTVSKIIEVRNIKEKDLDKHIKSEHYNFNRISPLTHIIDWGYLGKREENGDTVMYCLLSTTSKSTVLPILSEFTIRKIKVGLICDGFCSQIWFSDLFGNDFEHTNKLLADFGQKTTKITVSLQNIPIYCREIDIGFESIVNTIFGETGVGIPDIVDRLKCGIKTDNTALEEAVSFQMSALQNEINRVIQMFEDDIVSITKIIWTGTLIPDLEKRLGNDGYITIDNFNISDVDSQSGSDYVISAQTMQLDGSFNNAVGMAVQTYL